MTYMLALLAAAMVGGIVGVFAICLMMMANDHGDADLDR